MESILFDKNYPITIIVKDIISEWGRVGMRRIFKTEDGTMHENLICSPAAGLP